MTKKMEEIAMKKRIVFLSLLAALCCLFTVSAAAADAPTSGTCGENLTWTLDPAGTLTISGTGEMEEYQQVRDVPWYESRDQVKTAVIENGVTDIGDFAFDNCWSLTSVIIPESVTSIGKHALYGCRSLTSAILPVGVTTIGDYAFYNCGSLTDITLPECVTSIGAYAFRGCNLTSVTIPERVTTIGDSAFGGCRSLTSVTFVGSSQLTIIGNAAFVDCSSLTSITIPESVTSIGNFAFCDCSSLTSVTFTGGSQLTTIGNSAFDSCDSLTGITIPEGVTTIGDKAFARCSSLTSITIPEGVTTIGDEVFERCGSLTGITIPASVTSIGEKAFYWCSALTDVSITNMDAWCRIHFEDTYATPMCYAKNIQLNGNKIVSVNVPEGVTDLNYTFYGFKDLIRVTLPTRLTSIGSSTFESCTNLILVEVPEGVTNIGKRAFYECTSLASVTLPESLTKIDDQAFYNCRMSAVYISENVAFIGDSAFYGCRNLTAVTLPEGLTEIGSGAFSSCSSLASVDLPQNLTVISSGAFSYCGLTSVKIPDGVTAIGGSAFSWCRNLTDVSIPDGVTTIGANAFCGCESLPSITIPQAVTSIGDQAFWWCSSLKDVYITDLAAWCKIDFGEEYGNPLSQAKNLYLNDVLVEALEIPAGIELIPRYAFMNATCLKRVSIPRSLAGVAANAFEKCTNITEVFYEGSESEWANLPISSGNDPLKNAQVYFNSTLDDYYCRISVQVSSGGRVTVDHAAARAGDTVTVTAAPYQGYELTAICVDGAEIEGNTFTVTRNHVVSAVFTRLPVTGGTEDFRLEGLSVCTAAGEELQELPQGSLLVTVAVRHLNESGSGTILLAQYDSLGRYRGLMWLTLDEMPQGMTLRVTLPVDNSSGEIANLKVFVVEDLTSPLPVGTPVSFGQV